MKRRGTSTICNGQSRGERLLAVSDPAGAVAADEWQSTPAVDQRQTWGQSLWPDCLY